jgi:hypothetical protein
MTFNYLIEQALFRTELVLLSEQAEVIGRKLESLLDFAKETNVEVDKAKKQSRETNDSIDVSELNSLRGELMKLVSKSQRWSNDLNQEDKEKKLDDYIEKAYFDPTLIKGFKGETLPRNLNLRGLRYLHRRFIKN